MYPPISIAETCIPYMYITTYTQCMYVLHTHIDNMRHGVAQTSHLSEQFQTMIETASGYMSHLTEREWVREESVGERWRSMEREGCLFECQFVNLFLGRLYRRVLLPTHLRTARAKDGKVTFSVLREICANRRRRVHCTHRRFLTFTNTKPVDSWNFDQKFTLTCLRLVAVSLVRLNPYLVSVSLFSFHMADTRGTSYSCTLTNIFMASINLKNNYGVLERSRYEGVNPVSRERNIAMARSTGEVRLRYRIERERQRERCYRFFHPHYINRL